MSPEEIDYLAQLVRRRSGIVLTRSRAHVIEGRLAPVARRFGFRDVASLLGELRFARDPLARAVTEALTTNDSSFFRDKHTFEHLRETILPKLVESRAHTKHLRLWSAACAAGQEAYSLAMLLDEMKLVEKGWSIDIIATDFSSDLVARAEQGVYTAFEVERGLSAARLATHFTADGGLWRINDRLRRMIAFRPFNLLDSFGWLFQLDLALCRNVLIYFDQKTKLQVIEKIADVLAPDGTLVLGHAEYVQGLGDHFERQSGAAGCYVRNQGSVIRYQKSA